MIEKTAFDSNRLRSQGQLVWLQVGELFDGEQRVKNAHVVYDNKGIHYAGPEAPGQSLWLAGDPPQMLALPEYTLMPGLIEAHSHLFLQGGSIDAAERKNYQQQSAEALLAHAVKRMKKMTCLGITAIRDAGDKDGVGLGLQQQFGHGEAGMPIVDSPGAALHHQGKYGGFIGKPVEACGSFDCCVRNRIAMGSKRIKLLVSGIINFRKGEVTKEPQFTADEVKELVRISKELGYQTFAHASGEEGIERAIAGGVDSVEHGYFVSDEQLKKMKAANVAWVPTFSPLQVQVDKKTLIGTDAAIIDNIQGILDGHARSLKLAHELGVTVIAGSDSGSFGVAHGLGLLGELCHMQNAGLPALAVLKAATSVAAKHLAFARPIGRITQGYCSRMILTRHSPLKTVANLKLPKYVISDGRVFESGEHFDGTGL